MLRGNCHLSHKVVIIKNLFNSVHGNCSISCKTLRHYVIAHVNRHTWSFPEPLERSLYTSSALCCKSVESADSRTDLETKKQMKRERKEARRKERLERQKTKQTDSKLKESNALEYDSHLPLGHKKDTDRDLPPSYSPKYVEAAWYEWWNQSGFFSPYNKDEDKFVMVLPPPNVTGTLHLGHALGLSIQDALARRHRMLGNQALWVPGSDHAGIATQVVVERQLMAQGKSRFDLGREKFVEEVYNWKNEKGNRIYDQIKRMGASTDWDRTCFTLDPKMNTAVTEAFVRLYDEGLIYRGNRLVNWSTSLRSAISDIEVDNVSLEGKTMIECPGYEKKILFGIMIYFKYPLENSNESVTVATTRPETMLGDTAIAVHPDDMRYTHLHDAKVKHPFCDRSLPIICDDYVDMSLGTGAVKITPSHDPNDHRLGVKHNLEFISIFDDEGRLENVPERYKGEKRFHVREMIMNDLEEKNLLVEIKDHPMTIPVCSRSGDIIEPRLKDQWFLDCQDMGAQASQAVKNKELKLVPASYEQQWQQWLDSSKEWCLSRQLWWGHRIPAYKVKDTTGKEVTDSDGRTLWFVGRCESDAAEKASQELGVSPEKLQLIQDEDVLDTWFSSALFPFSVFGWPEQTEDLKNFYPTHVLETAADIIFFWVARMVMLGTKMTGQLPFTQVLFHGILRDAHGRKMSKSLGNIIDPMDVIQGTSLEALQDRLQSSNLSKSEKVKALAGQRRDFPLGIPECGTDALRFSMCSLSGSSHFVNVDVNAIKSNRNFCNKIWQAMKYTYSSLGPGYVPRSSVEEVLQQAHPTDTWILSCASSMVEACNKGFNTYSLQIATNALQEFWKHQFCDVYLEYSKVVFQSQDHERVKVVQNILHVCTDVGLRALHPFMPFLTEELYQRLPQPHGKNVTSVSFEPYPEAEILRLPIQPDVCSQMTLVRSAANQALNIRTMLNMSKAKANLFISDYDGEEENAFRTQDICIYLVFISDYDGEEENAFRTHPEVLKVLSRSSAVTLLDTSEIPQGCIEDRSNPSWTMYMQIKDIVDVERESQNITRKIEKTRGVMDKLRRSNMKDFNLENSSEEIITLERHIEKLKSFLNALQKLS